MEENKENKEGKIKQKKLKTKSKMRKGELAGRILAAIMVVMMVLAACSTFLYYMINS